jgi:hypothetical protein
MGSMKTTELIAWIGATTGIASLGWNIYTKVTANRPKLVVKAFANMIQMPSPPGKPRFLRMTVQNIGTAPTTLTNFEFFRTIPRWQRLLTKLYLKKRTAETVPCSTTIAVISFLTSWKSAASGQD